MKIYDQSGERLGATVLMLR